MSATEPTHSSSRSRTMDEEAASVPPVVDTVWSGCANGSPSTGAVSTRVAARAAASPSESCCRSDDVRSHQNSRDPGTTHATDVFRTKPTSTQQNSSQRSISYAVSHLKKKKHHIPNHTKQD